MGALERIEHVDAADRGRHRAERHPCREGQMDRALAEVLDSADGLGHRGVGEVGSDGGHRLDAEHEDQQRRHQRPAAHPGEPDENAYA